MEKNNKKDIIRKGACLFLLIFISISCSHSAKSGGVMLSSAELDAIGLRKTMGLKNGEIRLYGILYQSSDEWTIWLNTQPCTPKNHPEGITIVEVTPHTVDLKRSEREERDDVLEEDDEEDKEVSLPIEEKIYSLSINQIVRLK